MMPVSAISRLTDTLRMIGAGVHQGAQSLMTQMRLVAEDDRKMRQSRFPSGPSCGALNRTEHPILWGGIENTIRFLKFEAFEFCLNCLIVQGANDRDLYCLQGMPLFD